MKILAHRGFWTKIREQNKPASFLRALDYGFGIEFDVRDLNHEVIISHDMQTINALSLAKVFNQIANHPNFRKVTYAINIKSDGLEGKISWFIKHFGIQSNSFIFDMSVPSQYIFTRLYSTWVHCACRHSDIEPCPVLYKEATWVWLDELEKPWITNTVIQKHIQRGKRVCIVSPELHQRQFMRRWKQYRLLPPRIIKKVYLCTDYPQEADMFFNRSKQ